MRITILFLLIQFIGFSQVLDNAKGNAFTSKPFFNKTFIAKNNIKSIKGRFNYKKSGQAMFPTEYYYVYNFDKSGQLISTYETKKDDGSVDTTWNEYFYNGTGQLIELKQGSANSKTNTVYHLDSKNRVILEEFYTESIDSNGVKAVLLMNSEASTHEDFGLQKKRTVLNSYGLPYKTEQTYYDENGYLLEREERFSRTSNFIKYLYTYNEKGLLASISTIQKGSAAPIEEVKFKYDSFGNLMEKHVYKNGVFTTDTQIVYNANSKLMTSVIIRDVATNFLMVIRFSDYEYY